MIKNWLGREGLQLIATLTKEEQDTCNDEKSLFETLNKIQATINEKMKSFQFCKLVCHSNESVEEWMVLGIRTPVAKCKYKEVHIQLKQQFIHGLNDDEMFLGNYKGTNKV